MAKNLTKAAAYLRTSSATNTGPDKDSDKRQRAAIEAYAKAAGYEIVEEFYDAAVSGADPVGARPRLLGDAGGLAGQRRGRSLSRAPTDLRAIPAVQLAGHDMLETARHRPDRGERAATLHGRHADRGAGEAGAGRDCRVRQDDAGRRFGGGAHPQAQRPPV